MLSDDELHVKGSPFSLGAARAIATTLNALVYHSYFPKASPRAQQALPQPVWSGACGSSSVPPTTLRSGLALLERNAPQALRGLYERDQRRPFCQVPGFWTAPYDADACQDGAVAASSSEPSTQQRGRHSGLRGVAAVVQGLLFGTGSRGDAAAADGAVRGDTVASGGQGHSAAAGVNMRSGGSGAGGVSSPTQKGGTVGASAGMTALLRQAPQCVPFDVRLQLFRCGRNASAAHPSARQCGWPAVCRYQNQSSLKPTRFSFNGVCREVLAEDKARGRWDVPAMEGGPRPIKLTVRRDALLEDAFAALAGKGEELKGRLFVSFVNASGLAEAGLDHGGLTKELLEATVGAALTPGCGRQVWSAWQGIVHALTAGVFVCMACHSCSLRRLCFLPHHPLHPEGTVCLRSRLTAAWCIPHHGQRQFPRASRWWSSQVTLPVGRVSALGSMFATCAAGPKLRLLRACRGFVKYTYGPRLHAHSCLRPACWQGAVRRDLAGPGACTPVGDGPARWPPWH